MSTAVIGFAVVETPVFGKAVYGRWRGVIDALKTCPDGKSVRIELGFSKKEIDSLRTNARFHGIRISVRKESNAFYVSVKKRYPND